MDSDFKHWNLTGKTLILRREQVMLTIEVNGQFVTWPADFAFMMMRYYKKHDKPFVIHRKYVNRCKQVQ